MKKSSDLNDNQEFLNLKREYNKLTCLFQTTKEKFRREKWEKFLKNQGKNSLSSKPFWIKINKFRAQRKNRKLPPLRYENKIYGSDKEKANLFSKILEKVFDLKEDSKF
jgi:hypothetical protein